MSRPGPRGGIAWIGMAVAALLAGCGPRHGLQPFSTDGCSLFPDRAPLTKADWCACCVEHDFAYWQGGTESEREAADAQLRDCIVRMTGDRALAAAMYSGVRGGGTPHLATRFRWGYGWPFERKYRALSAAERARAAELAAAARAADPYAVCRR